MQITEEQGKVAELADETKQVVTAKASEAAEQGRSQLRSQVDQRSDQVAEQIAAISGALRSGATDLRSKGKGSQASMVEQGADKIEQLAERIRVSDADQLLRDAEAYARRRPMLVTVAGIAAGFGLARMLKASSDTRYRNTERQWSRQPLNGEPINRTQPMTPTGSF
ncbi:MAG: hypothetical protein QOE17_1366 [Gaiellales bacterium]|jgi:ElaB/YqjD/DUF883 family membrane-anchored ribosome-binding protein|nr:hypothetical protein [Gaiellales bacterium]